MAASRFGPQRAQPCEICGALEAATAADKGCGVYVVPTVSGTVEWARICRDYASLAIVAPRTPDSLTPQELMARLAGPWATGPTRVVVFSDQLVSDIDAPVLVEAGSRLQFLSSLEIIVAARLGSPASIWNGAGWALVPHDDSNGVLGALLRYLSACESLGDRWLMRDAQGERAPERRIAVAQRRVRLFESVAMHAIADAASNAEQRDLLERVYALRRRLTAGRAE